MFHFHLVLNYQALIVRYNVYQCMHNFGHIFMLYIRYGKMYLGK